MRFTTRPSMLLAVATLVAAAVASVALLTSPPAYAAGCKTTNTGSSHDGNSMDSSIYWCWDGSVVTSVAPSTSHQAAFNWIWAGLIIDNRCCVGNSTWNMTRVGKFIGSYNLCIRNEVHLNGDGSFSTNPGWYTTGC